MRLSGHIENRPSPNFGARVDGGPIDILLFHYTAMASSEAALDWLCDASSEVSSHYFVFEDGRVVQMVDEELRAFHAGVSFWGGEKNINSRSIGIEIANRGHALGYPPYPEPQIEAVIALSRDILARHAIPPERVLAHSDVAPLRKADPGERFPWRRLCVAGVGQYVAPAPITHGPAFGEGDEGEVVARFKSRLREYGYGLGGGDRFDAETKAVTVAFQRHFRPELVDGVADMSTRLTLERLIASLRRRRTRREELDRRFQALDLKSLRPESGGG
jgi:N-acetylmuramoyl-L-alanine amidase